jgi:hypothetical protein
VEKGLEKVVKLGAGTCENISMTPKQNIEICAFVHMLFCVLKWATLPKFAHWTICQDAHLCWMLMCVEIRKFSYDSANKVDK